MLCVKCKFRRNKCFHFVKYLLYLWEYAFFFLPPFPHSTVSVFRTQFVWYWLLRVGGGKKTKRKKLNSLVRFIGRTLAWLNFPCIFMWAQSPKFGHVNPKHGKFLKEETAINITDELFGHVPMWKTEHFLSRDLLTTLLPSWGPPASIISFSFIFLTFFSFNFLILQMNTWVVK